MYNNIKYKSDNLNICDMKNQSNVGINYCKCLIYLIVTKYVLVFLLLKEVEDLEETKWR